MTWASGPGLVITVFRWFVDVFFGGSLGRFLGIMFFFFGILRPVFFV